MIRHDWTVEEAQALFELPFLDLVHLAQTVHRQHHPANAVQLCTLSNIKTGGCSEDCGYCPQSARHEGSMEAEALLPTDVVVEQARVAKEAGASRFCMGAAWRRVRNNKDFDRTIEMVAEISSMGLEVCATLGMVDGDQAQRLADAGLTAYNHNIDTSPEYYEKVIGTRTIEDRLETLANIRQAGLSVCSGGIVGMGETKKDRAGMLVTLANLPAHPESVPINSLVSIEGTPMEGREPLDSFEFLRTIAVARVMMPASRVRLAAGRQGLSREAQAMAFMCGANSIFYGDRLLTTDNPEVAADQALFETLGLRPLAPQLAPNAEATLAPEF